MAEFAWDAGVGPDRTEEKWIEGNARRLGCEPKRRRGNDWPCSCPEVEATSEPSTKPAWKAGYEGTWSLWSAINLDVVDGTMRKKREYKPCATQPCQVKSRMSTKKN
eukprot:scaffold1420_cov375-Pavlova_lutheri.AAC.24